MIACVAIGFAVTAREALGRERGFREAREQARDEEEAALTDAKEQAAGERDRYRRLLDCHVDAALAERRDARGRPVPWPGRVLESFCATTPSWRRKLVECTGLEPREVERLLRSDLPITPGLARQLETFTGTPARYWERLWRLHDDRRTDEEDTVVFRVGEPVAEREKPAPPTPPAPPTVPPRALDTPPPVVPSPELAASGPRAKLPPPPLPQLRPPRPVRAVAGEQPARRAATLTSFPLQPDEGGTSAASASDWEEAERSPLNTTLPGVGRHG
ncbi:helix-turn-helix transcriptional regulator [Sorangium sp. KYC3313]|uniref:helix-turn-helix transcriptional regulator n=1 Tax=Sorangium sp. KYC3313 TaxID=3449740 RepID=UPI003F8C4B12